MSKAVVLKLGVTTPCGVTLYENGVSGEFPKYKKIYTLNKI